MREIKKLFMIFTKIGFMLFGGGAMMLPLLKAELVDKRKYLDEEELLDLYSISQCTPGIIAVNSATFIGYKLKGIAGAIAATFGIILPSLLIMMILASFLAYFIDNRYVIYAFSGIRIAILALIVDVVINLAQKNLKNWSKALVFVISLLLIIFVKLSPVGLIITIGIGSMLWGEIKRKISK